MEENIDTGAPVTQAVDNKQNGKNGLKIATAIACIVAICGVGFGAYGMAQSANKDSQISDLKMQIENSDETDVGIAAIDSNPIYEGQQEVQAFSQTSNGPSKVIFEVNNSDEVSTVSCVFYSGEIYDVANECLLIGFEGRISKIVAGERNKMSVEDSAVLLLMEDGSVYATPLLGESEIVVEKVDLKKPVIDILHVNHNFVLRFADNTFQYMSWSN